jgi:hypothetical protein
MRTDGKTRIDTSERQRVFATQPKEQRTHLTGNLGIDDREYRRPAATGSLAPYRQRDPAARSHDPVHFTQALLGIRQVHQAEGT